MGICGASQICRSKDNAPNSQYNMHDKKQSSLPSPHNNNAANQASIPHHRDKSNSTSNTNSNSTCHSLPTMTNSNNSHRIRPHHEDNQSPSDPLKLNRSRKSSKYVPLADDHDDNDTFARRPRATSQEVMTAAEYALIEDSHTKDREFHAGFVTPLATPSTHRKNNPSHASSPPHHPHSSAVGAVCNLSVLSANSQSTNSNTENTKNTVNNAADKYANYSDRDNNINISAIYNREANLSISNAAPSSLLVPENNPFPRYNSTSSDFADLVASQENVHRNNKLGISMDEITRDGSELFQWRLSHGSIGNAAGAQNLSDRVRNERTVESISHEHSLTDDF